MSQTENHPETDFEKGKKAGINEGMRLGILRSVSFILSKRFGDMPEDLYKDLTNADLKTLEKTFEQIIELELFADEEKK